MDEPAGTPISRSRLLQLGAATALGIGALPAARAATSAASAGPAPSQQPGTVDGPRHLRLATYRPLVGDTFRIRGPGADPLRVELVSAEPLAGPGETFSLIFRRQQDAKLEQSTYTFEHPKLGSHPLFLVPLGSGAGQNLQVIVNRLATPGTRG